MYLPKSLISTALRHYHAYPLSGHGGNFKTYQLLQSVVFWPKIWTGVEYYVKCWKKCRTYKHDNRKPGSKLQPITTTWLNEILRVDIIGPFPSSSPHHNEYLLVGVQYFTKWVEMFPMQNANAQTIALTLQKEILTRWDVPDLILSDCGTQFVSSHFKELCSEWNILSKVDNTIPPIDKHAAI